VVNVHPLESAEDIEPVGAEIKDQARISAAQGEPPLHQTEQQGDAILSALKESFFAGIIALAMFGPLVGIETVQNINNQLIYVTRPWLLAMIVGIVAAGRFLLALFIRPYLRQRRRSDLVEIATAPSRFAHLQVYLLPALLLVIIAFPFIVLPLTGIQGSIKWVDNFGVQILIYVMLGWGLNVVVGLAGLLDLGYVAFYAVGAYTYALLATHFGLSFWLLLPIAGILAASWGVALGFPVLRLRGDYLAIVTLAFGEIIRLVLINWREVTNGGFGIRSIPKVTLFGMPFDSSAGGFAKTFGLPTSSAYYKIFLYYLILGLALLTAFVTARLRRLPIGRAWESLREDEIACRSLGINTTNTKLTAFAIGAMFGGFAGSFFAARQGFVSPESFIFLESALIVAIVVLGGMGSMLGVAIAAAVMIGGTEILREMDILKALFGPAFDPGKYRMLIFGLVMVAIMIWRPRGFVRSRQPTVFLHKRKAIAAELVHEGRG
jgi:branched-chain amino acid transport system permease protein